MKHRILATLTAAAVTIVAALAMALPARADTIMSGFASHHFQARSHGSWCENNLGVGLRKDDGKLAGWAAGYYRNSMCRPSFYVAREFKWNHQARVTPGILLGAVTGYNVKLMPVAMPELVLQVQRLEVALLVQPVKLRDVPQFVALQARWRFR